MSGLRFGASLIAGVDVYLNYGDDRNEIGRTKIKVSDRIKRLELLGRHIGVNAFQERVSLIWMMVLLSY